MELEQALEIRRGITADIGGGGKTSLLRALGEELAGQGHRVLLCTTTKIFPFPGLVNLSSPSEGELCRALAVYGLAAAGTPQRRSAAKKLKKLLPCPVTAGALQKEGIM